MRQRVDDSLDINPPDSDKWYASWNWKTYTLLAIAGTLVVVLSTFFFLLIQVWETPIVPTNVSHSVYSVSEPTKLAQLKNRTNVLVFGVDERSDDVGRSDTLFILSVPSDDSPLVIVSIPRDTMVWLPEYGHYDKINHLYSYQGPDFTKSTVERILDISIQGHIVVNMEGFVGLVDELGGVTVDVGPDPLYYYDPYQDLLINLPAGEQHLSGALAMQFVRYREYDDADLGRMRAQQTFLQAFLDEFMAKKYDLTRLPGLITKGIAMVRTDLGLPDIMALVGSGLNVADKPITKIQLIGDGLMYNGIAYYILRYEETLNLIAESFFPEDEREGYVFEHLNEPWVRDYEYLRYSAYLQAINVYVDNDIQETNDVSDPEELNDEDNTGGYYQTHYPMGIDDDDDTIDDVINEEIGADPADGGKDPVSLGFDDTSSEDDEFLTEVDPLVDDDGEDEIIETSTEDEEPITS